MASGAAEAAAAADAGALRPRRGSACAQGLVHVRAGRRHHWSGTSPAALGAGCGEQVYSLFNVRNINSSTAAIPINHSHGHREKGQERKARRLDDWSFEPRMDRLSRDSEGARRQARHRCTQYPPIETQPSVQPGDPVYKSPSRKDRLRVFEKARWFAPCATRFPEHGLAQCLISWLC